MTLAALGGVRNKQELLAGNAITHDITRRTMHTRGYDGELISPEKAAEHLLNVAEVNDFTLFEHFLTDRAGHSGKHEKAFECLEILEQFLPRAAAFAEQPNHLFLLCSDHGNIEDLSTKTHTKNPVPLIALGDRAAHFKTAGTLADITPAILRLYGS
jgi:bisphosphoglycerate-independent phosphoglycerate mutase (AlkP superfamily)